MNTDLYTVVENAIRNRKPALNIECNATSADISNAIRMVMRNNPDIFWFDNRFFFDETAQELYLKYLFADERIRLIQNIINDVIENDFCISHVNNLPEILQIAYVYKWLVRYCSYNINSAYNQSIYSVFVRRNSVCAGYAKAAQYLFNLLGIESMLVFGKLTGDTENGRHCWNIVKHAGTYFHFDSCTGDDSLYDIIRTAGPENLFRKDGIIYSFLCVSTAEIKKTRSIEDENDLPSCDASLSREEIEILASLEIRGRNGIRGCLLSNIGSSADVYLCSKDKKTVLKIYRQNNNTGCIAEYSHMKRTAGCPHILQCNEKYTDCKHNIIAMEQAVPLLDLLYDNYNDLTWEDLRNIALDISAAWKECENKGILYRDIHICNVYRGSDGIFKVGDLGNCTECVNDKERIGSLWFMAPETYVDGVFTEASAVYSIAMIIYFILNELHPAYPIDEYSDGVHHPHVESDIIGLPSVCKNYSSDIKDRVEFFFNHALNKDPLKRTGSLEDLSTELNSLTQVLDNGCNINFAGTHGRTSTIHADEVEHAARTLFPHAFRRTNSTYYPKFPKWKESVGNGIFRKKHDAIYASVFAPAEIRQKSRMMVQIYLHGYNESDKIYSLASESDQNTERRDYIPLQVNLKPGDEIDIEFNMFGANRLMASRKSIKWNGQFTKCAFDYFVPADPSIEELYCEINLSVNNALIGEMHFITQIVETPRPLNSEIKSNTFKKIFISYAHQDVKVVRNLALAYKAQGVDYFFDREKLDAGDVYEEKIFDYIDSSDLFILCWSKNAEKSEFVAKEKKHALSLAYPQLSPEEARLKIYPVSIEPRAELPEDMKNIYSFEILP